ncbi:hypothetical protein [uncultured Campylobacter sp.]|uniref:hypothetical protein n=1 Tax=uncultured Campylobacter sp. TaxID=218934 RepID=UPI0026033425|nr:hypothetical protein [uncultured Campylobacter sp.]
MRLIGFIRGENVIVATGGVEYSYEMLGERDPSLTDGDEVSFDTLASSAINIERVDTSKSKDHAAQKAASQAKEATKQNNNWISDPKNFIEIDAAEQSSPQNSAENIAEDRSAAKATKISKKFKKFKLPRKTKPASAKKPKFFGFEFVQTDDLRTTQSVESKIYTSSIRKEGLKSIILPIAPIVIILIFRSQIASIFLSFSQIEAYVNQDTVYMVMDLLIFLSFALFYLLPLNRAINLLSIATHDQYPMRQMANYNVFIILCVISTILQDKSLGLDEFEQFFICGVIGFGLISFYYKFKAFAFMFFKTAGSILFAPALLVELAAIIFIGIGDRYTGASMKFMELTGLFFASTAWRYIIIFIVMSPLYFLGFCMIRRIKK